MKLIQTVTLASASASIELASIPQSFTDLVILCSLRSTDSSASRAGALFFNSAAVDSNNIELGGDGGSLLNSAGSSQDYIRWGNFPGATATSNTFGNAAIYVPNYTGSQNKTISSDAVTENNATSWPRGALVAGLSTKSAAITSITIYSLGLANMAIGSTISLYGILKGSDGITTAS
jgi:hypothetical protein